MDVCIQAGTTGGDCTLDTATTDESCVCPVRRAARRVAERLLDTRGGGRLGDGHGDRAEQDRVDRHDDADVAQRPGPGQELGRSFRGADAATDADDDVRLGPQSVVAAEQQVLEVDPGVVTASGAALDVHEHGVLGCGLGDGNDATDLVDGARLEGVAPHAERRELVQQRNGVVGLGDPRRDRHATDGSAGAAGGLHDALSTQVQPPQVGVQVEGVEHDLLARDQQLGQFGDALGEDLLGDLPATGQLGQEPGVGGRRDDACVDRGRRHARQHHRRTAGRAGEAVLETSHTVVESDHGRREGLVTLGAPLGRRADRDQCASAVLFREGECLCTGPAGGGTGELRDTVGRAQIQEPLRGTDAERAVCEARGGAVPAAGSGEHRGGELSQQVGPVAQHPGAVGADERDRSVRSGQLQTDLCGPAHDLATGRLEHRVVARRAHRERFPGHARSGRVLRDCALEGASRLCEGGRRSRQHRTEGAVVQRDARAVERRTLGGVVPGQQLRQAVLADAGDGDHRRGRVRVAPERPIEQRGRHGVRAGAGQVAEQHGELQEGPQQRVVRQSAGLGRDRCCGDHAPGVPGGRDDRARLHRRGESVLPCLAVDEQLGQQDAGQRERQRGQLPRGRARCCAGQPGDRIETGRGPAQVTDPRILRELRDRACPGHRTWSDPAATFEDRLEVLPPAPPLAGEGQCGCRGPICKIVRERTGDGRAGAVGGRSEMERVETRCSERGCLEAGRVEAGRLGRHRHLALPLGFGSGAAGVPHTPM